MIWKISTKTVLRACRVALLHVVLLHMLSLTRATGDHLIDKAEIVAFCEKNPDALSVLGVASVEELMGKFDQDGSGQLDEDELKQLRAYIQQKRKENQERIRKLQEQSGPKSALRPASGGRMVRSRCHAPHVKTGFMCIRCARADDCSRCRVAPVSPATPGIRCCKSRTWRVRKSFLRRAARRSAAWGRARAVGLAAPSQSQGAGLGGLRLRVHTLCSRVSRAKCTSWACRLSQ